LVTGGGGVSCALGRATSSLPAAIVALFALAMAGRMSPRTGRKG
jgi:hypothetical protein